MARISSWSCLLALWLAQLQCVSAEEEKSSCLKSLNSIYEAERKVRNDAVVRQYVLCENTEFYVALNFDEDGVPLDGQYPIPVGRPNIHVFCGEDGKSENNCQLVRGLVHVGVVDEFGSDTRADNVLLQGLTFFRATSVNVIAMIGGDITLQDCVFKRNRNVASIYAVSPQTGSRRKLSLISNDEDDGLANYIHQRTDRSLQFVSTKLNDDDDESINNITEPFLTTTTRTELQVIIINCVFSDNVLGASPGADSTAIIYSVGASVDMRNSVIVGTTKDIQKDEELPHMIYVKSAPLILDSNCFMGNDEAITPVVIQQPTTDVQARLNFNQRTTSFLPNTNCEFVATNSSTTTSSDTFVCTSSDSDVCQAKATAHYRYPCVSYLDDIYFSEWDVDNSDVPRTYILCPQSTFRVGSRHDSDGTPQGGSYPIILGHSNIRVLCGADGRLENGCDVENGVVQIAHFDEFQTGGQPIVNTLVQGISFSKASAINALISGSGDVVIRDCVFKDNVNVAAVYAQVLNPKRRGRKLAFLLPELVEDSSRGLLSSWRQDNSDESLVTQIDSCVFTNNTIGSAVNPVSGLITNDNATMTILNSMIVNTVNAASKEDLGYFEVGYLIGNMNGETRLAKNCFYDNEVTLAPVLNQGRLQAMFNAGRQAMAPSNASLVAETVSQSSSRARNNAEEEALSVTELNTPPTSTNSTWSPPIDHANARCEFVATVKGPDDVLGSVNPELVEFDCLTFDSETCHHPDAPTSFPTMSPTISPMPTSMPTYAPTPQKSESSGKPSFGAIGQSGVLLVSIAVMLLV